MTTRKGQFLTIILLSLIFGLHAVFGYAVSEDAHLPKDGGRNLVQPRLANQGFLSLDVESVSVEAPSTIERKHSGVVTSAHLDLISNEKFELNVGVSLNHQAQVFFTLKPRQLFQRLQPQLTALTANTPCLLTV